MLDNILQVLDWPQISRIDTITIIVIDNVLQKARWGICDTKYSSVKVA
jgi:hypothetical protein